MSASAALIIKERVKANKRNPKAIISSLKPVKVQPPGTSSLQCSDDIALII